MPDNGRLITLEGIDGAGKSLQTRLLAENLRDLGHLVVTTFEPGGGQQGGLLRDLLTGDAASHWSPATEALLFTAARRHHLDGLVLPAIAEGKIVICDRFADSTRVYQGFDSETARHRVDQLHTLMIGTDPELTFIIDIPVKLALERVARRSGGDARLDTFGSRLEDLRKGFLQLQQSFPHRCRVVNGDRESSEIASDLLAMSLEVIS